MSDKVGHRNRRHTSLSEKRALEWVASQEKQAIHGGNLRGEKTPTMAVALTVRRLVLGPMEGGIFDWQDLTDLMESDHGANVFGNFGTSLVSPSEGKKLVDPVQNNFSQVKQKLEAATGTLPSTLEGFVGRALIVGTPPKEPGPRFVGYSFDPQLHEDLKGERKHLGAELNGSYLRERTIPHITLFTTNDQELAVGLRDKLNELRTPDIPIELGPAEVITISHVRHLAGT